MASWSEVEAAAPELAARVRATMDAHKHKVLATLRRDGSPRVSGIEADFRDGELWLGMMPGSRKATDLRRDPRMALHSTSVDPTEDDPSAWPGDAKLAGRAVEVEDPALLEQLGAGEGGGGAHLFRVDLAEVVHTRVGQPADHLVIEVWRAGAGLRRLTRA
ncbi:MAG TPA: pyridoxamine 5'-phosphate oxidase family protein [Actinomycetes bacterium]|nr:pyridoxamine 5'-phosphate oxidase family protein [Actinomycetes bacterium]